MNNETTTLLTQVLIAVLPILTAFTARYLNAKALELKDYTKNKNIGVLIDLAQSTIQDIVIETNQTVVETLKKQGAFDKDVQKQTFNTVKNKVLKMLTIKSKQAIELIYGDLNDFIDTQIEVAVNRAKKDAYLDKAH